MQTALTAFSLSVALINKLSVDHNNSVKSRTNAVFYCNKCECGICSPDVTYLSDASEIHVVPAGSTVDRFLSRWHKIHLDEVCFIGFRLVYVCSSLNCRELFFLYFYAALLAPLSCLIKVVKYFEFLFDTVSYFVAQLWLFDTSAVGFLHSSLE